MYLRAVHAEPNLRILRQLIRDNPLGILTTAIQSDRYAFLQASPIPFVLDVQDDASETEKGRLRGHIARQNPQAKVLIETLTDKPQPNHVLASEVLVVFTAQQDHYVTPKFYTETKPATGKVVPTWNYAAAQVYGKARIFFDTRSDETSSFLQKQIADLSYHCETSIMGYVGGKDAPKDWKPSDAPENFVALLKKNIIGIEIEIDRLEGKFKMSQEMGKGDREGVIEGFRNLKTEAGDYICRTVKERGA